jgi:hypothetical protein
MMLRNKAEEAFSSRTGERLTPEESCLISVKITAPSTRLDMYNPRRLVLGAFALFQEIHQDIRIHLRTHAVQGTHTTQLAAIERMAGFVGYRYNCRPVALQRKHVVPRSTVEVQFELSIRWP